MKHDFSKPLTEDQLEAVRYCQDHDNNVLIAGKDLNLDPTDVFWWTIQDYEGQRAELKKQADEEGLEGQLLKDINALYEKEVHLRKIWEDWLKENGKY